MFCVVQMFILKMAPRDKSTLKDFVKDRGEESVQKVNIDCQR